MSLNGLDDAQVTEAYQSTLADAGGWFLLKYVSRDAIQVYKRGNGGVQEARAAIAEYQDKSPLYGFLIYRRRKVLVKYIPDGVSRLVQARVTVHFQSFEDRFKPHDTVVIIATSAELTDYTLSTACSLHSAAETTRSSGSSGQLRKSKLDEILEDPKERPSYDARAASFDRSVAPLIHVPTITETAPIDPREKALPSLPMDEHSERPVTRDSQISSPPPLASRKAAAILGISMPAAPSVSAESTVPRPSSSRTEIDAVSMYAPSVSSATRADYPSDLHADYLAYLDALDARSSTSTARPSLSEMYAALNQKPKVKLGPRPSADKMAGAATAARTTASLPPGMRAAPRRELHSANRPASRASRIDPAIKLPPPPPIPETPQMPEFIRPSSSPASIRSIPTTLASKSDKMTPEKKRLKKAMEMRKKQIAGAKKRETVIEPMSETKPAPEPKTALPAFPMLPPISTDEPSIAAEPSLGSNNEAQATSNAAGSTRRGEAAREAQEQTAVPEHAAPLPPSLYQNEDLTIPSEQGKALPAPNSKSEGQTEQSMPKDVKDLIEAPIAWEEPLGEETVISGRDKDRAVGSLDVVEKKSAISSAVDASGGHPKADSAVQVELGEQQPEVAIDHPGTALSPSPISVQQSSDMPSTRPSSMSEAGEEGTLADVWAREAKATEEEHLQAGQTVQDEGEEVPSASETDTTPLESSQQTHESVIEKVRPNGVAATAAELEIPAQAETRAEEDGESDTTPTEKSILHTGDALIVTPTRTGTSKRDRRLGMVAPMTVEPVTPGTDESEVDMSDDDLISELQNAEVQEAKPIQVPRGQSPESTRGPKVTAIETPRSASNASTPTRRPSQPLLRLDMERSSPELPRSASFGQLRKSPNPEGIITVAKSVNVSSGISQRIKALARNSSSSDMAHLDRVPSRDSSGQSIVALRKSSLGGGASRPISTPAPPLPASARERVATLSRNASTAADFSNRSAPTSAVSPPRDSIHAVYNVSQRPGRPESISVTARIVRDDRTQKPSLTAPTQVAPLELHESPLIIEHQHQRNTAKPAPPRIQTPKPESPPDPVEPSSPVSPARDRSLRSPISPLPRTSSDNWRSSFSLGRSSRRNSDAKSPPNAMKSSSSASLGTVASRDSDTVTDKRGSRSSRMFKRMSNSMTLGRKTITQIVGPTVEEPSSSLPEPVPEEKRSEPSYAVEIGDLNVQLPDTLLWKRRWVEIDNQGNFVVKMSKSNEMANTKNNTKSFRMSELKRPFLPDQERQEMPNSVVIDFVDGRTMQCACETAGGQMEVLRLLQEAHQSCPRY